MQITINKKGQLPGSLRKSPAKVINHKLSDNKRKPNTDLLNASTGELNPKDFKRSILPKYSKKNQSKVVVQDVSEVSLVNDLETATVDLESLEFIEIAEQLECVRTDLFEMLITNIPSRIEMAKEYLFNVDNGESPTELFSLNRSKLVTEKPGDEKKESAKQVELKVGEAFRQILKHDLEHSIGADISTQIELIKSIHFLPVYLLQVASRIKYLSRKTDDSSFDSGILKSLSSKSRRISKIRSAMVTTNLGLVKYMSRQYRTQNMTPEDLQQEGVIGLLKAVDRFDHRREFRFSTYASYWVRQTITRSMGKNEKLIRIPINLAPKAPAVFQMVDSQYLENHRIPSVPELAKLCKMSEDEISTILEFYRPTISLDGGNNDDAEAATMFDLLEQQQFPSAMKTLSASSLKEKLKSAISSLPEKEACVIRCRYGLENQNEMTLQDIANSLQVTRERVRQIQNSGLKKLNLKFGYQLNAFLEAD